MNAIQRTKENATANRAFTRVCLASCRKLIAQIQTTKDAILNEFRKTLGAHERMLRLALNEAEALAWQTDFPHLVFPMLATEKARAVVAWHARQQSMDPMNSALAFAA